MPILYDLLYCASLSRFYYQNISHELQRQECAINFNQRNSIHYFDALFEIETNCTIKRNNIILFLLTTKNERFNFI